MKNIVEKNFEEFEKNVKELFKIEHKYNTSESEVSKADTLSHIIAYFCQFVDKTNKKLTFIDEEVTGTFIKTMKKVLPYRFDN